MAQSRSYLYTLDPQVGIIYILGALGDILTVGLRRLACELKMRRFCTWRPGVIRHFDVVDIPADKHIYTHICVYIFVCIYIYIYTYMYMYKHVCTYTYMYMCVFDSYGHSLCTHVPHVSVPEVQPTSLGTQEMCWIEICVGLS